MITRLGTRLRRALAAAVLCSLAVAAPAAAAPGFVGSSAAAFSLDGRTWQPFGYNQYRLTSMAGGYVCDGGYGAISDASLDERLDDMKAAGANTVRTWFFQSYYDAAGWAPFDRVIEAAATRGMSVVPVLVNHFPDCEPAHAEKTRDFYDSGFRSAGAGYLRSFKAYARMVAEHYASERAIAFWQLVNEAETKNGGCSADAAAVLRTFAKEMRDELRSVDSNHLVSLGTIGTGQCGASGEEYKSLHEVVDICEMHDYNAASTALPGDASNGFAARLQQCNDLGKPIFVGEAGIVADVGAGGESTGTISATTLDRRGTFFAGKLRAQLGAGMDGYLIWDKLVENSDSPFNLNSGRYAIGRFGVGTTEDPVAAVMRAAGPLPSPRLDSGPSGTTADTTPTFTFSSSRRDATFECRVDAGPFAACASPHTTAQLARGAHDFEVRATSGDPTPARRNLTISAGAAPPPAPGPGATPDPGTPLGRGPGCPIRGIVFTGTDAADVKLGGVTSDVMLGRGGDDAFRSGSGRDCVYGDDGDDTLAGGAGADLVRGGAGDDTLDGGSRNDRVAGEAGRDRIGGGAGDDVVSGGADDDVLIDHAGRDTFVGGAGDDRVDARDRRPAGRRVADVVRCGAGRLDIAIVDRRDRVAGDCEFVLRSR
jgi:mannan endo-1,4-beta-mannosidase